MDEDRIVKMMREWQTVWNKKSVNIDDTIERQFVIFLINRLPDYRIKKEESEEEEMKNRRRGEIL